MPTSLAPLEVLILEQIAHPRAPGTPGEDDAAFNALALKLHRHQREHNLPYRRFCEAKGGGEPQHWREIPAVPTSAFRHAPLRTFPEGETRATFRTSGTTGEGFGEHHFATLALYEASILGAWRALGVPPLPQLILVPPPAAAPHSSLSHMMGVLARAGGPQVWGLTPEGRLDRPAIEAAAAQGPLLVLGTALAFLHLFEQLGTRPLPLAPGSLAMETGGYKGSGRSLTKEALYARFGESLGLAPEAILNEYSMTELSSQWYTRGLGAPHHGPPWTRAVVIDPVSGREVAPGETGVVHLYDLANVGSVLAIATQDLAVRSEGGVSGFRLLGRDPAALPRGCSRAMDEQLRGA